MPSGNNFERESLIVTKKPEKTKIDYSENNNKIILKSNELKVEINETNGVIAFYDLEGKKLVSETPGALKFNSIIDAGNKTYKVKESFNLDKNEAIYGVGQIMDNKRSRRGEKHWLQNENGFTYAS